MVTKTRRECLHTLLTEEECIKLRVLVRQKGNVKVNIFAGRTGRSDMLGGG